MKIKNQLAIFIVLMIVWILINNSFKIEIIAIGAILSFLLAIVFGSRTDVLNEFKFTPAAFFYTGVYLIVFLSELIKSNIDVALRVLKPSLPINPGIVKTKTVLKSKMARMILTNSITLTPGTLTVDIEGDILYIHWIDVQSADIEVATEKIVKKFENILVKIYG
ncbi:MAG TPA: Na+/H+ antiporter subunit E [Bacteroidales bacterium]|nr:Na+/H+ antiporter subunit E [Bacteroidales bacterium]